MPARCTCKMCGIKSRANIIRVAGVVVVRVTVVAVGIGEISGGDSSRTLSLFGSVFSVCLLPSF